MELDPTMGSDTLGSPKALHEAVANKALSARPVKKDDISLARHASGILSISPALMHMVKRPGQFCKTRKDTERLLDL